MGEVVESSQLATGEKTKNILTGVYDIIASVDFANKLNRPAYIASYDSQGRHHLSKTAHRPQ